jgi:hypothetical protein
VKRLTQISVLLLLFAVVGCGTSQDSNGITNANSTSETRSWTREDVFNQSLDITKIKEWGYYGNATEEIQITDYNEINRSQLKDLIGVKPTECLPLAALIENAPQSEAEYSLRQDHKDSSFPDKAMTYQVFFYESATKAVNVFDSVKNIVKQCGTYTANYLADTYSQDLWSSAEISEAGLIRAYNPEYDEANAIGQVGSVIFTLYFLDFEDLIDAKSTLEEAIEIVSTNLQKIQKA